MPPFRPSPEELGALKNRVIKDVPYSLAFQALDHGRDQGKNRRVSTEAYSSEAGEEIKHILEDTVDGNAKLKMSLTDKKFPVTVIFDKAIIRDDRCFVPTGETNGSSEIDGYRPLDLNNGVDRETYDTIVDTLGLFQQAEAS